MIAYVLTLVLPSATIGIRLGNPPAYHDPAFGTTAESYQTCSDASKNHPERSSKQLIPQDSDFDVSTWAKKYDAVWRAHDITALAEIGKSGEGFKMNPDRGQPWFSFIQAKSHMLDALENRMPLKDLWKPGNTLMDVGCGHGYLVAYLAGLYDVHVVGYEIPFSYQCKELVASPLTVNFYDGKNIPESGASYDAVSFMSVLHHAAANTPNLLEQAASIAKTWILVLEDVETGAPENHKRNMDHDSQGIFRSDAEWKELFRQHCKGFEVVGDGYVGDLLGSGGYQIGARDSTRSDEVQTWYVLKRVEV